ncbi:MAG TPA: hypothetical protein VEJ36_06810 [Nitrososphaerales archaeon]|nr:hypothetical protein [Nitrososphaerales archaeon]
MKTTRILGLGSAIIGLLLLLFTFFLAYGVFVSHQGALTSTDLSTNFSTLLQAAIQALFLGIMGWAGSLLMIRGIDYEKIERGVGVVTFKVDKGVGIMTQQSEQDEQQKSA